MAQYDFYNAGTNSTYNNATAGNGGGGYGSAGGGGGSSPGGSSNTTIPATSRTISFQINSTPQGGMIFIDGQSTQRTTPNTLEFTELELLTPKRISVVNGNSNSTESYILSSQKVTNTTTVSNGGSTTTTSGGSNPGGGGGYDPYYDGGYSGGRPGDAASGNVNYLGN